jgi:mercuric ion transport protein
MRRIGIKKGRFQVKLGFVDKIGSLGTFLVASACPVCWPLFIPVGSALGLGFLQQYEGIMMDFVFPPFVLLTLLGSYFAYRVHKTKYPLIVSTLSGLLIFIGFYGGWQLILMYIGIFGLLLGSILAVMANKQCEVQRS